MAPRPGQRRDDAAAEALVSRWRALSLEVVVVELFPFASRTPGV